MSRLPQRWLFISLVFLATLINFIDRLTLSTLAPVIVDQLKLTHQQFGSLTIWFLVAYTASQGLSGAFYDRVGVRRGMAVSVLVWSIAATGHAFARGLMGLRTLRFVLGVGEAGNWPGAAKVIAAWFPARERALAMGIFNSGVAVGLIVAPPLIVWLQLRYGWQTTFLVTGAMGFCWLALWLRFYRAPAPDVSIAEVRSPDDRSPDRPMALLADRRTWAIVLARFITDPVWWLYITWLPLYLAEVRGFSLKDIGLFAWVPYVAADAGSLLGGWFSGHLIARGWTANAARKLVIGVAAVLMLAGIPAAMATTTSAALMWISFVTFGFQSWINNVQTLPTDWFPERAVGSVTGLGGVGAGIGAILFTTTTGYVVDHYSYTPILITAALLPIAGTAVLLLLSSQVRVVKNSEVRV